MACVEPGSAVVSVALCCAPSRTLLVQYMVRPEHVTVLCPLLHFGRPCGTHLREQVAPSIPAVKPMSTSPVSGAMIVLTPRRLTFVRRELGLSHFQDTFRSQFSLQPGAEL